MLALFFAVFFRNASSELVGGVGGAGHRGSRGCLPWLAADGDEGGLADERAGAFGAGRAEVRGTFMPPLGGLLAFIKAPIIFLPVGVELWMVVISFRILSMSGVLAALNWG